MPDFQVQTGPTRRQNFISAGAKIWNPAGTFRYSIVAGAIAANRNITLPTITGTDTIAVLGLAQTFSAIQTHSADIIIQDASDLAIGSDSDVLFRWSDADSSNHTLVLALGDSNQSLHITDKNAVTTDWNIAGGTNPAVYIHSNTTPATDYFQLGGHDGTSAFINIVGGTAIALQIAGTTEVNVTANGIEAENAAGPAFVNEAATTTNPTLVPDKAELDTGIGWASDTLHFVLGGTTHANLSATAFTVSGDASVGDDLLLTSSGSVVNWVSGDITLTHSAGTLTYGGDDGVVIAYGANVDLSFTGGSTENEITLTNSLADALSITRAGTDMMVFNSSTPSITFTSELTVGVNDAGHDVKFFGNTASAYMEWDTSEDDLVLGGAAGLVLGSGGIKFLGTQSEISDVNTLDDYEEGTFTPLLGDGSSELGSNYNIQVGEYTKIGNRVFFNIHIRNTDLSGLSASAQLRIVDLPFTAVASVGRAGVAIGAGGSLALDAANQTPAGAVIENTDLINFGVWDATTGLTDMKVSELSDAGVFALSGSYRVAT